MFIVDLLIYIFFAWVMYSLAKRSFDTDTISEECCRTEFSSVGGHCYQKNEVNEYCDPEPARLDSYTWAYIIFFTLICGFKYCLGGDYFAYAKIFEQGDIVARRADEEIIWNTLVMLTSRYSLTSIFGFGVCAFLQIFFIVKACDRCRYLLIWIPMMMFGSRYFIDLNGAIRQMAAACFFLWFSKFIYERRLANYVACVFIASMLHHSALVLLPFYFIPNCFQMASRRILMLGIFIACFIAGLTPTFGNTAHYMEVLTQIVGYEEYSDRTAQFLTHGNEAEALSFGPMMLSYFLIALILIIAGPSLKVRYEEKIPLFNLWYNLSFFYGCAYFLFSRAGHIFIRPVLYFEFFQMVMGALMLYDIYQRSKLNYKFKYYGAAFIVIVWMNLARDIQKSAENPFNTTTYKSIIFK